MFRFTAWPQEALKSVARHFLDAVDMEETIKGGVVDVCVDMQQRARDMAERYRREMGRYYYVTPTSYLELINTFKVSDILLQRFHTSDGWNRTRIIPAIFTGNHLIRTSCLIPT